MYTNLQSAKYQLQSEQWEGHNYKNQHKEDISA